MKSLVIAFVTSVMTLAACATPQTSAPTPSPASSSSQKLSNPASVYCKEHGGSLAIRSDASGAQAGVCQFADGTACDEWAYFRGECGPGTPVPSSGQMTEAEARAIAANSACGRPGPLKETAFFNPNSRTWWIDMAGGRPGCNPACVVGEDRRAEINWRCTGALPPGEETPTAASAGRAQASPLATPEAKAVLPARPHPGWTVYTNANAIRKIAFDRDGRLWAATTGGALGYCR